MINFEIIKKLRFQLPQAKLTLDEFGYLFYVFLSYSSLTVSVLVHPSDFKCLTLSVPDEGKSRKALWTHEII